MQFWIQVVGKMTEQCFVLIHKERHRLGLINAKFMYFRWEDKIIYACCMSNKTETGMTFEIYLKPVIYQ